MNTETYTQDMKKEKKQMSSAISGGIFLICLGVLMYTGWWWPGIMFAIGFSASAGLVLRGKTFLGIGTLAAYCAIPIAIWIIQKAEIPWSLVGPLVLVGIGIVVLVKAAYQRVDNKSH